MTTALVLSGGIGKRLISEVPKQYVTVGGKMIVIYTGYYGAAEPPVR